MLSELRDNVAAQTQRLAALGGGIYNSGTLTVLSTTFARNQSLGTAGNPGGPGSAGIGGAISSFSFDGGRPASAVISHSTFVDNRAIGGAPGAGGAGGNASGGAIQNDNGSVTVSYSLLCGNRAVGASGAPAGSPPAGPSPTAPASGTPPSRSATARWWTTGPSPEPAPSAGGAGS
jgi:hypothetical protein